MVNKRLLCGLLACAMAALALPMPSLAIAYAQPVGSVAASAELDARFDAAFLLEEDAGALLYAREADRAFSPVGSAVCLMAAYIVANEADLEQEIPVIDGVNDLPGDVRKIDLIPGRRWIIKDLVAAMLLQGAQDAALVLSDHVSGSAEAFAALMNEYAAALGMSATRYVSPLGGYAAGQTTTVSDLAILSEAVLANDYLRELLSMGAYDTVSGYGIKNRMEIMQEGRTNFDARIKGLGAGSTSTSGTNMLIRLVSGERSYVFIGYSAAAGQKDCENNAIALIDGIAGAIEFVDVTARVNELLSDVSIVAADGTAIAPVAAKERISAAVQKGTTLDQAQLTLGELPALEAAAEQGTSIGTVVVQLNGASVAIAPLAAGEVQAGTTPEAEDESASGVQKIPVYSAEDWKARTSEKTLIEKYGCFIVIGAALALGALTIVAVRAFSRKKHK